MVYVRVLKMTFIGIILVTEAAYMRCLCSSGKLHLPTTTPSLSTTIIGLVVVRLYKIIPRCNLSAPLPYLDHQGEWSGAGKTNKHADSMLRNKWPVGV